MKITRTHIIGWTGLIVAAAAITLDFAGKPEPANSQAAPATVFAPPADDGMLQAAGNLHPPGKHLYFGRHEKIYRGQIIDFVRTPEGEAAVIMKNGNIELMLRRDIASRDFWVRAE